MDVGAGHRRIERAQGDITELEVDAVVNAANAALPSLGGTAVFERELRSQSKE